MKKVLFLLLILLFFLTLFFANHSKQVSQREETSSLREAYNGIISAIELFQSHLPSADGSFDYPDTYAGYYVDNTTLIFLITDLDQISEYQYLKEAYPDIEFKEVKYSYNYLQSLIDDYKASYKNDQNKYLGSRIDEKSNRAVIYVDQETLAQTQVNEDSPLIFEEQPLITFP